MNLIKYLFFLPAATVAMGFTFPWSPTVEGNWKCRINAPIVSSEYNIQYIDGGATNLSGEVNFIDANGAKIEMSIAINGTWRVKEDQLIESITSGAILSLKIAGLRLSPDRVPQDLRDTLFSSTTASKIVKLDKNNLQLFDPEVGSTECKRIT